MQLFIVHLTNYLIPPTGSTILLKWDDKAKRLTIGKRSGSFDGMPLSRKFNVKIVGDDKVREIRYKGNQISVK